MVLCTKTMTSASNWNITQQPSNKEGVSSSTQDPGGRLTSFLAARNERQPAVVKCQIANTG